jgi:ABC-type multidrug transport system ATPase subunit
MENEYQAMRTYYQTARGMSFTDPDFVPGITSDDSKVTWVQCPSTNTDTFFQMLATDDELEAYVSDPTYGNVAVDRSSGSGKMDRLCGAVIFGPDSLTSSSPEIKFRFNLTWNRPAVYSDFLTKIDLYEDTRGLNKLTGSISARRWYMDQGFIGVQLLVQRFLRQTHAILVGGATDGSSWLDTMEDMVNWRMLPFPALEYSGSESLELLANFQFVLLFCYATTVALTIGRVVSEREQKLREYMRMMGMYDCSYYVAWILALGLTWLIIALTVTAMQFAVAFRKSSFGLVFMFNYLFGLASMSFSLFISSLCTRERLGSIIGAFVFFIGQAITAPNYSGPSRFNAASILPPSAYIMGVKTLFFLETTGKGLTRETLDLKYVGYSLHMSMSMLAVDILFWWLLFYYVEQVNPFLTGYRRVWYFPFTKVYWKEVLGMDTHSALVDDSVMESEETDSTKFEQVSDPNLLRMEETGNCIEVKGLKKKFGASFYAVNGLDLTMYSNEIFCLLGHNGAGKTTTFSMLTGMLAPTAGRISAFNMDIPKDMAELRRSLGVCPQHSALWPDLTVREHLLVFGGIRGLSRKELEPSLNELIAEVGLSGRGHFQSKALSGGMKRKLSVGIAFVGNPKIVFLDEPTSGMDPFARRSTWDLLKRKRSEGRVICLTTHYMDEADVLGDRIAIMANGKLECNGTSSFLKRKYGLGYLVSFVLTGAEGLMNYLKSQVGDKNVRTVSSIGKEVIVEVIPEDEEKFANLLEDLDKSETQKKLGIQSFGISVTKIEEVFLKVARDSHTGGVEAVPSGPGSPRSKDIPTTAVSSFWTQFKALFERRIRYGIRDRQLFFMQIILPFLILLITLGFLLAAVDQTPTPISLSVDPLNPGKLNSNFVRAEPVENVLESSLWADYCAIGNSTQSSTACNLFVPQSPASTLTFPYGLQQKLLEPWPYNNDAFFAFSVFNNTGDPLYNRTQLGVWQNSTGLHTTALAALMHFNAWASSKNKNVQVSIVNDPFPNTLWEKQASNSIAGAISTQMIIIAMAFLPTAVISFIVMEKEKEVKNQLAISGVSPSAYWLSHFVFDTLVSIVSSLVAVIVFWIYNIDSFTTGDNLAGSFSLLLLYGPASTAFAYACSFFFTKQFVAQSFIAIVSFVIGNILVILSYVLQLIPSDTCASCKDIGIGVMWGARILPPFALGSGFYRLTVYVAPLGLPLASGDLVGGCQTGFVFGTIGCFSGIGDDLLFLGLATILFLSIAIFVDFLDSVPALRNLFVLRYREEPGETLEDDAVVLEKQRVEKLSKSSPMLYVKKIRKIFRRSGTFWSTFFARISGKKKVVKSTQVAAVESVSFAADKGEVFGLLGVNGAGKTTTFKMLCGLYCPSGGEIYVLGNDATKNMDIVRRHIGYCPQFDALWDLLSTEEHIMLYAKIRGYKGADLQAVVKSKLRELDLMQYTNARAGTLSGGNKRKLSVAMALVGEPDLVFLDEPSCGMDPFARRGMWSIIESVADKRKQCVIVLTTHSMEEAEALCSRIAIQVDGRFRCLGSCQEIKSLYGDGFEICVRAKVTAIEKSITEFATELEKSGKDGFISVDNCSSLLTIDSKQGERAKLPVYGLSVKETASDISTYDVANWQYKDQIFGRVIDFLIAEFGATGFEITELHGLVLKVKVGKIQVSALFRKFLDVKEQIRIDDFQITQTPLEQIFNRFAATAKNKSD